MPASYSAAEILDQLDDCAKEFTFPMLDNGYVYPADVRLTAYRDHERWALAIEVIDFHLRAGGHDGVSNCLHLFGNCLKRRPGTANEDFLHLTDDGPDGATFDEEVGDSVHEKAKSIRIRGHIVPLNLRPDEFMAAGVQLEEPPKVFAHELLRLLVFQHRTLFLATEQELRQRVPPDLPQVLRLDQWHHPDLADDELPSQSETFRMIAEVLVTDDQTYYRPSKSPNTHWKNWPEGGTL